MKKIIPLLLIFAFSGPSLICSEITKKSTLENIQIQTLADLLFQFDHSEQARISFKNLLPKEDIEIHFSLCKACCDAKKNHLIEVLFALVPKSYKKIAIEKMEKAGYPYRSPRPGTLGSEEIYSIRIDNAEVYFFMDLEKYELARKMVENVSDQMQHGVCAGEFPLTTIEVSPICTIFESPVGYDDALQPIYRDPRGRNAIEDYTYKVAQKIKDLLGCTMLAVSRQMSLVVSHDAMRFHRDQLPDQYAFLNQQGVSFPTSWLAQDLTLMDWDMSEGTLSGTIMEETETRDRFYFFLKRGEVTTNLTLDPPLYPEDGSPPVYPGAKTLPFHSAVAPIDMLGGKSIGSSKGKRISNVVRGVVLEKDVASLRQRAIPLPLNRPTKEKIDEYSHLFKYPNGILRKEFLNPCLNAIVVDCLVRLPPQEEVEILTGEILNRSDVFNEIKALTNLDLKNYNLRYYKLVKRGVGFSNIADLGIEIPENSLIIAWNRAKLPEHYEYYPFADSFSNHLPWIQLYPLGPNALLQGEGRNFQKLALTSIEEIFFRNAVWDAESVDVPLLSNTFATEIDLLVFTNPLLETAK